MPFDVLLNEQTGDIDIVNGDVQYTSSKPQLLRQAMAVTFTTWTGEWFWNLNHGAINRAILFKPGATKNEIDAWFISVINGFSDVIQVLEFESELITNTTYSLRFVVLTDEGRVSLFVVAEPPSNEIDYPEPLDFNDTEILCPSLITLPDADRLYELIHITWPANL